MSPPSDAATERRDRHRTAHAVSAPIRLFDIPHHAVQTRPYAPRRRQRAMRVALWSAGGAIASCLIGLASLFAMIRWQEHATPRIVALMYHRFVTDSQYARLTGDERIYCVSTTQFAAHLRRLREEGYVCISLAQLRAFLRHAAALPPKPVLITIDDGCRSVATHAVPLLRDHGARAVLFLTTDPGARVFAGQTGDAAIDSDRAQLTASELRALDPNVIEFGAHGHTHEPLDKLTDNRLSRELAQSRLMVEAVTGAAVDAMAVPGNWYDQRVLDRAADTGYEMVFVSDPGAIHAGANPLQLPRLNVSGTYSDTTLMDRMSPSALTNRRFRWMLTHWRWISR